MKKYFLSILICFFSLHNYAQFSRTKNTYVVNVSAPGQLIRAEVLDEKSNIKPKERLRYFWYGSNKITETQGGYDGKLLHGQYTAFYFSNNLREKGEIRNGLKSNQWMFWYENGNVKEITTWKKGLQHGPYKTFDETGKKTLEAKFRRGMLHGHVIKYEDGKMISDQYYINDKEDIKIEKPVAPNSKESGTPKLETTPKVEEPKKKDDEGKKKEDTSKQMEKKAAADKRAAEKKALAEKKAAEKALEKKKKEEQKAAAKEAQKKSTTPKTSNY